MHYCQKTIRAQGPPKKAFLTLAVVNYLTTYRPIHSWLVEIRDVDIILGKPIRQDPNRTLASPQIDQWCSKGVDTADGLHRDSFRRVVLNLHLYVAKGQFVVNPQNTKQARTP